MLDLPPLPPRGRTHPRGSVVRHSAGDDVADARPRRLLPGLEDGVPVKDGVHRPGAEGRPGGRGGRGGGAAGRVEIAVGGGEGGRRRDLEAGERVGAVGRCRHGQ